MDMLLLAAIERGASHGYAISEELRSATRGTIDLPDGTIYPALRRLEKAGYLKSEWTEGGGRKRRVYKLTASGTRHLNRQTDDWTEFQRGVARVLRPRGA